MIKAVLFDFNRTLYDPDSKCLEPGALQVLAILSKRFKLGLLSKTGDGNRDELLKSLGIRDFFEVVVTVKEKSVGSFEECVSKLGVQPDEVLAIGDQARKDVAFAKAAGCRTAWFCKGKFAGVLPESAGQQADFTVKSLDEILCLSILE